MPPRVYTVRVGKQRPGTNAAFTSPKDGRHGGTQEVSEEVRIRAIRLGLLVSIWTSAMTVSGSADDTDAPSLAATLQADVSDGLQTAAPRPARSAQRSCVGAYSSRNSLGWPSGRSIPTPRL